MLSINVFEDKTFWYVQKKSQKILEAIYLITQGIKDNEPLKVAIRARSIKLIEVITESYSFHHKDREMSARRVSLCLTEMMSLLDVAATARLISPMNHTIVRHEVAHLINLLAERYLQAERAESLDTSFFKETNLLGEQIVRESRNQSPSPALPREASHRESPIRLAQHARDYTTESRYPQKDITSREAKSPTTSFKTSHVSYKENTSNSGLVSDGGNKSLRRSAIVSFIKDKGTVSIKDIVSVVTDCSEKTIQRELLALVEEGVLKKQGERRWSVYQLAQV